MSLVLIIFIAVGATALGFAVWTTLAERSRRTVMSRVLGPESLGEASARRIILGKRPTQSLVERLAVHLPSAWAEDRRAQDRLVQAGHDTATAPYTYVMVRVALLATLPSVVLLVVPKNDLRLVFFFVAWAVVGAWILPAWALEKRVQARQERIKRSLPDALDLLVVCVEAGVSLDAAILRVAREMSIAHPELSREFMVANRKTNAGMPREEALRGLFARTGVEEVRALVSSMIQSEKWGTSIAKVLRVYAETVRRKRRQIIEKKAAVAPMKMLFPLIIFIFPALFIVILGPAVLSMMELVRTHPM